MLTFRRELPQTGAHGQWRGGRRSWRPGSATGRSRFASNGGLLQSVHQGLSLNGALPATGGRNWYAQETAVQEWLRDGRIPADPEELREMAPQGGMAPPKSLDIRLMPNDVFEIIPNPGGGFGDPLLRAPELLESDLQAGRLPRAQAEQFYGVVLDADGSVDVTATAERRERMRAERLARSRAPRERSQAASRPQRRDRHTGRVALAETAADRSAWPTLRQAAWPRPRRLRRGCRELEDEMTDLSSPLDPVGTGRPAAGRRR